ncbi:DUF2247 family protein [Leptospira sp. WS92.C1]
MNLREKVMQERHIPLKFIDRLGKLSWPEVLFGMREGWLSPQSAIDIAVRKLESGSRNPDELKLAGLLKEEITAVHEIVTKLTDAEVDTSSGRSKVTWLRLLMAWLYENRSAIADPFRVIEELYADFEYLAEIRHLVRYNESTRGFENNELAQKQMEDDWAEYVRNISLEQR